MTYASAYSFMYFVNIFLTERENLQLKIQTQELASWDLDFCQCPSAGFDLVNYCG